MTDSQASYVFSVLSFLSIDTNSAFERRKPFRGFDFAHAGTENMAKKAGVGCEWVY
jgi:hypothetical protein